MYTRAAHSENAVCAGSMAEERKTRLMGVSDDQA